MSLSPNTRRSIPTLASIITLMAVGGLILMLVLRPKGWWVPILTGGFAAATVGALTDWFAVTAVFRRIPIPLLDRRTDIIIQHRHALEASLMGLLHGKVISPDAIRSYLQKEPLTRAFVESADQMEPGSLERTLASFLRGMLNLLPADRIAAWTVETVLPRLAEVDIAWLLQKGSDHVLDPDRVERLGRFAAGEVAALLESELMDGLVEESVAVFVDSYTRNADGWLKPVQDLFRELISGALAKIIQKSVQTKIETLVRQLREIERTGQTDRDLLEKFNDIKAKAVDALRAGLADPELAEQIKSFIRGRLEDSDSTSKRLSQYLRQIQADLMREDSRTLYGLAQSIAANLRAGGPDHWLNRLALEHLPELVSHPDIARKIEDSMKGMKEEELREEGAARVAPDLAAIRITGTALGFIAGCAIHGVLVLIRSLL